MCALMTPIIKSEYKLYPGMPVVRKNDGNTAKLPSNNHLSVPKQGRIRSTSNVSAQSNPEISVASNGVYLHPNSAASGNRQRSSLSVSQIAARDRDDVRRQKLQQILEEKERQRRLSTTSDEPMSQNDCKKNHRFAKLLKHFGIPKKNRPKNCESEENSNSSPIQQES